MTRLVVYGGVQGVGFRYFVRQRARSLGLRGYVLNRPDGSVELEADGPADAVEELIRTVRNGPPAARVERVVFVEPEGEELPEPFEIRR